jgi:hypothetical protein
MENLTRNAKTITLKNEFGKIQEVKLGCCGWTLLSGVIIPPLAIIPDLTRGNFKYATVAFIMIILSLILVYVLETGVALVDFIIMLLPVILYASKRNKYLLFSLFEKGYKITGSIDESKDEVDTFVGFVTTESLWK